MTNIKDRLSPQTIDDKLNSLLAERSRMLSLHQQLLKTAQDSILHPEMGQEPTAGHQVLDTLERSQDLLEQQARRIEELQAVESAYEQLLIQYNILRETNDRLLLQLSSLDDQLQEKRELEDLIAQQRQALEKLRLQLQEIEKRYQQALRNIQQLQSQNHELKTALQKHREELRPLFDQQEKYRGEARHLRQMLRQQELSYLKLMEDYERICAEYEAMYGNIKL